ncbi:repeat domain (List_Bact_rpt) [Trichlorobacter thiogenes]|uniref:Repeat domain (List_Bact_rpt) n=1 Tax=Trichlorobacter thiogenes TaxID=115783 RepID=A0A1T4NSN9_9BACT|nr:DUF1566 domain-containing protein [Trichlorobacter thiogenes]SJZ82152.1 repeat domain (List_Bact_rpt) [Trichlorobacter thiogenes]
MMRQFKLMLVLLFSMLLLCSSSAWSLDRFVDLNDGTMLDTFNNLRWLKNANCFERQNWDAAMSSTAGLAAPACGLSDGSAAGDWHLPTIDELNTLVAAPAKYRYDTLNTAGFSNVQAYTYWSSSTYTSNAGFALSVDMRTGYMNIDGKTNVDYVWPVRAGQHWSLDPLVILGAVDFGTVSVGTTSSGHPFTLKNSGASSLSVTSIALNGPDSGQFTLAAGGTNPCSSLTSLTLNGGASCTVLVSAKPAISGSKSANLTVSSGGSSLNVPLTATGSAPLSVTYSGNGNSSGSVPTDSTAYATGQSVTVLDNSGALAKSGYIFNGWNTAADGSGTGYQPGATFTISADTVLYARWTVPIAPPSGLISWWRGEGAVVDSVGGNTGTSHLGTGIVTATAAENATATATCNSGEIIVSYSSIYGAGSQTISCGSCTFGANSCSVTYSNANCTDPAIGTAKSGTLSLTCTVSTGAFPTGKVGQAIRFNGSSEYVTQDKTYKGIASSSANSSFTMEFWAKPTATITNLAASQTTSGYAGASGQRYAIFPEMQGSTTEAGAGVSVGTNGIMVTEHAGDYLPAPLVYPLVDGDMPSDGWLHIAVVYESQTPKLYVNGVLKQTGLNSGRTVYPSSQFGGTSYGFYSGLLDELHIFNRALTVTEIQSIYNAGPAGLALVPTVTGISPSSGPAFGGTIVTITGSNLTGATAVMFGSTAATGFTVNSDSQITAVAPAGSTGTVDITVTTPGGISATSSADQFTYLVSAPTATTLAASSVTGTTATLNGRISANNSDTTVTFEYGTSSSYGSTAVASPNLVSGDLNTPVSAVIEGINKGTTYHYRVKGASTGGIRYGDDMTFTTPGCTLLNDGGFEAGTPNPYWTEASTNFGTPLCTFGTCGGPSGAVRTGNWWVWFGGIREADEIGSMTQSVLIPANSLPRLNFYLYNPAIGSDNTDFLKVFVDGNEVFGMLAGNPAYTGGYTLVDLDLSSYADGMCHTLSFQSTTHVSSSNLTNIFVDDVAIPHCSSTVRIDAVPSVSLQQAMNDAGSLSVISATAHVFTGDLLFSQPGRVTFKGGYDCSFLQNSGYTTIGGKLAISGAGTLVVEKMIIK